MKTSKTGLLVHTYRPKEDCSNGGLTCFYSTFVLIDDDIKGPFRPKEGVPELRLCRMNLGDKKYIYAVPTALKNEHTMFGGNFIWTSDSRLNKVSSYPIPVHDRVESTIHLDGFPHESLR